MKIGDKILIKESFGLEEAKGAILASLPPVNSKKFLVEVFFTKPLVLVVEESEFARSDNRREVLISKYFCQEKGSYGTIIQMLPRSRYLCEFDGPFCNIVLKEKEIMKWDPEKGVFALLDIVRLTEDFPEYNLKKGMEGTIVLVFFKPSLAYDVEFHLGEEKANPEWDSFTFLPNQLEFIKSL